MGSLKGSSESSQPIISVLLHVCWIPGHMSPIMQVVYSLHVFLLQTESKHLEDRKGKQDDVVLTN